MREERQVTWKLRNGQEIIATITHEFKQIENIAYADGWNVPIGTDYIDELKTVCTIDGRWVESGIKFREKANLPASGAIAKMGKIMVSQDTYERLKQAYDEIEVEMMKNHEYIEHKRAKEEKQKKMEQEFKEAIKQTKNYNPLTDPCPKCGTYCMGDCGQ